MRIETIHGSRSARSCWPAGRKSEALKQYEALANETKKPPLKAEATVRAGMLAVDLAQGEKGKADEGHGEESRGAFAKGKEPAGGGEVARDRAGWACCVCNINPVNTSS